MEIEVRVPSAGESVREGLLAQWIRRDGERVRKGEPLFVIETDKITFEVPAEADGVLRVQAAEGETVAVGSVVARIEAGEGKAGAAPEPEREPSQPPAPRERPAKEPPPPSAPPDEPPPPGPTRPEEREAAPVVGPTVRRLLEENGLDAASVRATGPGGRLTRGDVLLHLEEHGGSPPEAPRAPGAARGEEPRPEEPRPQRAAEEGVTRKPLSPIRRRIAERLLQAKQQTAMLTTFNDVDMTRVQAIRAQLKESFKAKHGVSLGLTSFFVRAAVEALREFPQVNAFIEGDEMVFHDYCDVGIAVGSGRGLVVPVLRRAERLSFAGIEQAVADFVLRIRENRLAVADLEGGTFTITNGGVFGSLLSTPILNPPQSAILGLHRIEDRPVAVEGQVVVRPMMYVALSYDHRIIDGREAVTFLRRIKELVEAPERLLVEA